MSEGCSCAVRGSFPLRPGAQSGAGLPPPSCGRGRAQKERGGGHRGPSFALRACGERWVYPSGLPSSALPRRSRGRCRGVFDEAEGAAARGAVVVLCSKLGEGTEGAKVASWCPPSPVGRGRWPTAEPSDGGGREPRRASAPSLGRFANLRDVHRLFGRHHLVELDPALQRQISQACA